VGKLSKYLVVIGPGKQKSGGEEYRRYSVPLWEESGTEKAKRKKANARKKAPETEEKKFRRNMKARRVEACLENVQERKELTAKRPLKNANVDREKKSKGTSVFSAE